MRFGISFYPIAMLFILFDIEVVFLYPIAVDLRAYGSFALAETIVFIPAPVRRLRLRVAQRGTAMEVKRQPLGGGGVGGHPVDPDLLRIRATTARRLLRGGDVEGPTPGAHLDGDQIKTDELDEEELERYVHERVPDHHAGQGGRLGAPTPSSPQPSALPAARSR